MQGFILRNFLEKLLEDLEGGWWRTKLRLQQCEYDYRFMDVDSRTKIQIVNNRRTAIRCRLERILSLARRILPPWEMKSKVKQNLKMLNFEIKYHKIGK